ncbi:MAG: recombinase family protein, partial [Rhodospirillales bacterium]|nr:recombinase family protein [Rhodospirillales bacterium]
MRAVIYARYSSNNQPEASIEDQVRQCRKWIDHEGHTPCEVYSDHAISGASTLRPGYQKMLEDARSGAFDILIAEALDRLSRDQEDIAGLYKQLSFAGVKLVTLSEGEVNELHVGLKGTMNALFLKDLAQKTRRGLEGRVRQGFSGGGNAYGFDVVRETDAQGEPVRGKRRINEHEAAVVRRIFEAFVQGHSPRVIARTLNTEGVPGPKGRPWRDTTIRGHHTRRTGILRNDLYVGRLVWNKQHYVKDPRTGKRLARPNPEDQWIVEAVPHLRIVDDDLWNRVRARLGGIRESVPVTKARKRRFWEHRRARHLFTGLMVCAECGGSMIAAGKDYMACDHARNQGTCSHRRGIKRQLIEEVVLHTLKTNLMQPDLVAAFISAFHAEVNRLQREHNIGREHTAKEFDRVARQLDGLYEAIADGLRTAGLKTKLEELEQRKTDLDTQLSTAPSPAPILHPNLAELYRRQVEGLHASLNTDDCRTEAAEVLRGLVETIKVRNADDGLEIELIGEIVNMIDLAQTAAHNKTAALKGAAVPEPFRSSVKVVAGVGFEPTAFR